MKRLYPLPRPEDDYIVSVESYQDGVIQVGTRSYIEWSIFAFGAYDRATVELLTRLVHPGYVVFDVGVNVGNVTLAFTRRVGPQGIVHSFEPHPVVRRRLRQNIALNNLSNVHVCTSALGPVAGTATLHSAVTGNEGWGSLAPHPELGGQTYTVEVKTLDNYAANLPQIHLIKVDAEGSDYGVLEGARGTIQRCRPGNLHRGRLASSRALRRDAADGLRVPQSVRLRDLAEHDARGSALRVEAKPGVARRRAAKRELARRLSQVRRWLKRSCRWWSGSGHR